MAYFRYDHRGCGKSNGEFASATTFEGRCRDLISTVKTVRDLPETGDSIALFGSSLWRVHQPHSGWYIRHCLIVTVAAHYSVQALKIPMLMTPKTNR